MNRANLARMLSDAVTPQRPTLDLIAPTQVQPQPVPTQISVAPMQGGMVAMQITTPCGVHFAFLDGAAAKDVARHLEAAAGAGLVVAKPAG